MPYGIAKKAGGDSAENDAKMERCIKDVQGQGHNKIRAILICKSSIQHSQQRDKKRGASQTSD